MSPPLGRQRSRHQRVLRICGVFTRFPGVPLGFFSCAVCSFTVTVRFCRLLDPLILGGRCSPMFPPFCRYVTVQAPSFKIPLSNPLCERDCRCPVPVLHYTCLPDWPPAPQSLFFASGAFRQHSEINRPSCLNSAPYVRRPPKLRGLGDLGLKISPLRRGSGGAYLRCVYDATFRKGRYLLAPARAMKRLRGFRSPFSPRFSPFSIYCLYRKLFSMSRLRFIARES